ncbi:MAG: hypothetical protein ACFE0J_24930 [Elainellaceae cyanobacterium]
MDHLIIIGGSDASISAAFRAKEINSNVAVTVLLADNYPNYSICGLPFFLSGEVSDWHDLAHQTKTEIERLGIRVLTNYFKECFIFFSLLFRPYFFRDLRLDWRAY